MDEAQALALDGSGNIYVTGYSWVSDTNSDYATVKYDPGGNQLWAARYNGPGNPDDWARAIALDGSGNIYVTGYSGYIQGSGGDLDYATIKYTQEAVVRVGIDSPIGVLAGSEVVVRVNISPVTNLDGYQFDVSYDPAIIQVIGAQGGAQGVSPGLIDSTLVPVAWAFVPSGAQGKIRVLGNLPGIAGKTGSGFLSEVHFRVVGSPGQNSSIRLSSVGLFNHQANEIAPVVLVEDYVNVIAPVRVISAPFPAGVRGQAYWGSLEATGGKPPYTWAGTGLPAGLTLSAPGLISGTPEASGQFTLTVTVADSLGNTATKEMGLKIYRMGDATGDDLVNMGDVTRVERMILGLDPPTAGADANGDGVRNMGDVVRIEMIILGIA